MSHDTEVDLLVDAPMGHQKVVDMVITPTAHNTGAVPLMTAAQGGDSTACRQGPGCEHLPMPAPAAGICPPRQAEWPLINHSTEDSRMQQGAALYEAPATRDQREKKVDWLAQLAGERR